MRLWMSAAVASLFASAQALPQAAPFGSELVLVEPKGTACLDTRDNTRIPLRLTNRSTERIAFHLSAPGQERDWLHARSFDIELVPPRSHEIVGGDMDEYARSERQVRFESGDQMDVFVTADLWPRPGYTGKVRARVRDTQGRLHVSEELDVCPAINAADTER